MLTESASDGIVLADLEGRPLDGNRRFLESAGYAREELIFLTFRDIHPPEEAARPGTAFRQIREKGTPLAEHRVLRKDGSSFPVEVARTLIEMGDYCLALGTFRDISERTRMEKSLQKKRDKLDLLVTRRTADLTIANKELEVFSYSVSHDLRAPLRAINGYCELLGKEYGRRLDEDAFQYLERIRKASSYRRSAAGVQNHACRSAAPQCGHE